MFEGALPSSELPLCWPFKHFDPLLYKLLRLLYELLRTKAQLARTTPAGLIKVVGASVGLYLELTLQVGH
jgi:hypothetical protein